MTDREKLFLDLVRDNDARVWRICRVYARVAHQQEDLYQDILVQLWRSLPSFRGGSKASTWLYRVALNTALGFQRRQGVRKETPLAESHELHADHRPGPDQRMEAAQRRDRLHAAIDRLDDLDKALVTLHLEERSYAEMAEILGISEGNVGVKLHRIRKRLASLLEEKPA